VVEGNYRPSAETKTHLVLYKAFPKIMGICHTHSTFATAWAQAGRDIPTIGTTQADYFLKPIPCTDTMSDEEINGDYETEIGNSIVRRFKGIRDHGNSPATEPIDPVSTPGVLVRSNGPFAWGKSAKNAVNHVKVIEQCARMAFIAKVINSENTMPEALVRKHYNRRHGPEAYYGQK
jgi:L-ribulose-5-phosphate 4-epimerase